MTTSKRSITDFFTVSKKQKIKSADSNEPSSETDATEKSTTTTDKVVMKSIDVDTEGKDKGNVNVDDTQIDVEYKEEFDVETFKKTLTPEELELLELELTTIDPTWLKILHTELRKPYFLQLKQFLKQEFKSQTIFPPREDIYSWTRLTPLPNVKVLILGQDPYHNINQAHGLAFSVKDISAAKFPPSLRNIYKGLAIDYPEFEIPKSANLTKWANEGVLLLNTSLTVRAHNANSHAGKGWEVFTKAVVKSLMEYSHREKGIVVVSWGMPAQKLIANLGKVDWDKNLWLKSVHPSPLSARRGFFEAGHFKSINIWLRENWSKQDVIDWCLVEGNEIKSIKEDRRSQLGLNDVS